jgi:Uncharacterized protein conserved in bacteria
MDSENNVITINTHQFGEITIDIANIFLFPNGLLGFEELKKFILISDEETEPFKWLISVEEPSIGFPIISPFYIDFDYNIGKEIDLENNVLFVVVTLQDENKNISANLKAPIILNLQKMTGEQFLIPFEKYSTSHIISHSE